MDEARLRPHHSRTHSQLADNASDYQSSDDGYDYNVVDDAPEAQATKPKEIPAARTDQSAANTSAMRRPEVVDNAFAETMPHIFQRHAGGRRAKIPTDIDLDLEKGINGDEATSKAKLQKPVPTFTNIKLRWTMPEIGTRRVLQLNYDRADEGIQEPYLHDRADIKAQEPYLQRRRVRWHHSREDILQIDAFEELVLQCQSQGASKGQKGLTRRLLKRVRKNAERDFVGGRFLTPLALRYDNQDVSRYSVDKTCIFFSFPYFLMTSPGLRKHFEKGDSRHPSRTLLQSHYRLNKTIDRDEDQCISLLKDDTIASLIDAPYKPKRLWSSHTDDYLVFVPQFWGVIDGLDTLISSGPIDEVVLESSVINIAESTPRPTTHCLSLVRILFQYQNRQEDLIYPVIQCDSWFGLLNKQEQILEYLGTENDKPRPKEYRFWFNQQTPITINNWAPLLSKYQGSEIVDIWMKKDTPKIDVHSAEGRRTTIRQPTFATTDTGIPETPGHVAVVKSFFAWDILDEFGEADKMSLPARIDSFLKAIYIRVAAEAQIQVEGKTEAQVQEYLQTIKKGSSALELGQNLRLVFLLYIPVGQHSALRPVEMYWGAVYEIVQTFNDKPSLSGNLERLSKLVSGIVFHAQRLHQGVYCSRAVYDSVHHEWRTHDAVANGAILLAVVVDALGAILRMIVETVKCLRDLEESDDIMGPTYKIAEHGKEACELLKEARDQLIREADGRDKNGNVGPVVTPEAITIALLERLSSGVAHTGTLDIIHLYEECLENLALKVKYEASRRLLQRLNGFQEEVTIVKEVLTEQVKVLTGLRASLDPKTFNTPSITRKLRYCFECKAIDMVSRKIQEQMKNCDELIERARLQAVQNVQLVETFQDDNSKAIFVFTMVTILFLPMSFVAGFFGMNVIGLSAETTTLGHFWTISLSLTFGLVIPCTVIALKGEEVFFSLARMYRWSKRLWSRGN